MDIRPFLAAAALTLTGTLAHAEDDRGFYTGAGAGIYYFDIDGLDFNETAPAVRLFGGYELNEYVSFEAGFTNLFEASTTIIDTPVDVDGTAWDLSVRPSLPIGDQFKLYGVLGYAFYDFTVATEVNGLTVSDSDKDDDLLFGLGGEWDINPSWSLRGEWTAVDVSDADFGFFNVAVTYSFR